MSTVGRSSFQRVFSQRGWTVECEILFQFPCEYSGIEQFYRDTLQSFLHWLENDRLRALVESETEQGHDGRRSRLHRLPERWRFSLTALSIDLKYLSVTLSVASNGQGIGHSFSDHRVWDTESSLLCPLTCFMTHDKAKKYEKWAYSLVVDELVVYSRKKRTKEKHDTNQMLLKLTKYQNLDKSS